MTAIHALVAEILLITFSFFLGYNVKRPLKDLEFKRKSSKTILQVFIAVSIIYLCVLIMGLMHGLSKGNISFPGW